MGVVGYFTGTVHALNISQLLESVTKCMSSILYAPLRMENHRAIRPSLDHSAVEGQQSEFYTFTLPKAPAQDLPGVFSHDGDHAPATERLSNKSWVRWRYSCPKFLRQPSTNR